RVCREAERPGWQGGMRSEGAVTSGRSNRESPPAAAREGVGACGAENAPKSAPLARTKAITATERRPAPRTEAIAASERFPCVCTEAFAAPASMPLHANREHW